jgi:hypothetical protein
MQQALETARQIGSERLEMRSYTRITHALEGRGDHERAIQAGRESAGWRGGRASRSPATARPPRRFRSG